MAICGFASDLTIMSWRLYVVAQFTIFLILDAPWIAVLEYVSNELFHVVFEEDDVMMSAIGCTASRVDKWMFILWHLSSCLSFRHYSQFVAGTVLSMIL